MRFATSRRWIAALALAALAGCGRGEAAETDARAVPVDSARPMKLALDAFRAGLPPTRELGGSYAADRDSLVRRFVSALERSDTAAFMPMMMSRAEFAWLFYEHDPQSKPPYELPPEVMWMQGMQQGERGIARALRDHGGRALALAGYACERQEPRGAARLWTGCLLDLRREDGSREKVRLFGGILEHGGRYKFSSYANDL